MWRFYVCVAVGGYDVPGVLVGVDEEDIGSVTHAAPPEITKVWNVVDAMMTCSCWSSHQYEGSVPAP